MEDLFKNLGKITKPEKQGGFFDLPQDKRCKDKSHKPPTHIYIPQGKGYRHVCPSCGKVTDLIPPQISFWNVVVAITANIQIDEIKVLQKYHETFIHRSFYTQNI